MRLLRRWAALVRRVDQADQEVTAAQERLERARREVVGPLQRARDHNQFAQMLRDSLRTGKGHE